MENKNERILAIWVWKLELLKEKFEIPALTVKLYCNFDYGTLFQNLLENLVCRELTYGLTDTEGSQFYFNDDWSSIGPYLLETE